MRKLRLQTRDLRPSDILTPTNRVVVRASRGVRTPTGKTDVDWQHLKGKQPQGWLGHEPLFRSTFGTYTSLTVFRD